MLYVSADLTNSEQDLTTPSEVNLHQNYPNPFNPTTNITFELDRAQMIRLDVYNMLGQKVMTLADERLAAGSHSYVFKANNLASGVYFYQLTTSKQVLTNKMTLVK